MASSSVIRISSEVRAILDLLIADFEEAHGVTPRDTELIEFALRRAHRDRLQALGVAA